MRAQERQGKPFVRRGRKTTGLIESAGSPTRTPQRDSPRALVGRDRGAMGQGLDAFGHHNPGPGSPARRRIGLLASALLAAAVSTTGLAVTASPVEGSIGGSTVGSATAILTSAMTRPGTPSSTAQLQNPVATVPAASTTTVPLPTPTTTLPGMALPVVATTTPAQSATPRG